MTAETIQGAELPEVEVAEKQTTFGGWLLLLLGISLFGSAFKELRPTLGPLSIHPYVFVLALIAIPAFIARPLQPVRRGLGGVGIAVLIGIAFSFLGNNDTDEAPRWLVKWATVGLTFVVTSRLVRKSGDVALGAIGLVIAATAIGVRGMILYQQSPTYYMDVMKGIGSRNVYSLWTLVPTAFCIWWVATPGLSKKYRLLPLIPTAAMAVPQFLSLSRSGWMLFGLTIALVFGMKRSLGTVLATGALAFAITVGVQTMGFSDKMNDRFTDLQEGTTADDARADFIATGLELFVENPLLGVSLGQLPKHLGRAIGMPPVESHNFAIDMLAGTGLMGTLPLLLCVVVLMVRWRQASSDGAGPALGYVGLLPILLVLTGLRGLTTNEVIFNPSVIIGLGLVYGALNVAIGEGYFSGETDG